MTVILLFLLRDCTENMTVIVLFLSRDCTENMTGIVLFLLRDCTENMTGIVYTDEGGQEQSLLGKLVYTTDETGSGNIILQVQFFLLFLFYSLCFLCC